MEALHEYLEKVPDDDALLTIAMQTSPWRIYDAEMRIVTVEEMAETARSYGKGIERVQLIGSWTAVAPEQDGRALAGKLSDALDGLPVEGMDGFLWVSKDGGLRTTHQAFTIREGGGPYVIRKGDEVMASLVAGWPSYLENHFVNTRDALGVRRAGAGWDTFFLCPDRALQAFEVAAGMSDPIAAYNAALMRLERGDEGDTQAAMTLLSQAAELGDSKSRAKLVDLQQSGVAGETHGD